MKTIKDITGKLIEVTNLKAAIKQCRLCADSPFKMPSGHTVGENHKFMLSQLEEMKQKENYKRLFPTTIKAIEKGKRLTKCDMGYQIGHVEVYHPASIYWDKMSRDYMVKAFNKVFGTSIT